MSGTGVVADGVEWPDGTVTIRWRGEHTSTVVWPSLAAVEAINGHDGATRIVWDPPPTVGRVTVTVDTRRVRAAVGDELSRQARSVSRDFRRAARDMERAARRMRR